MNDSGCSVTRPARNAVISSVVPAGSITSRAAKNPQSEVAGREHPYVSVLNFIAKSRLTGRLPQLTGNSCFAEKPAKTNTGQKAGNTVRDISLTSQKSPRTVIHGSRTPSFSHSP